MSIAENYRRIQGEVADAAAACGRDPADIRIMAVSKTKPLEAVVEAYDAGLRLFGENRVAEGIEKFSALRNTLLVRKQEYSAEVHLIGHLQRNKAKTAVFYNCIQSIDKKETADALLKALDPDASIDVLLEANTSGEASKSGVHGYDDLRILVDSLLPTRQIRIRGLMTIAPFVDEEAPVRMSFAALRTMSDKIISEYPELSGLELSMGMSDDFRYAIMEGSTLLRLGTALFGKREYKP